MNLLVPVRNNTIVVYCPHENCGGWVEIDVNKLIKNKKIESVCNKRGVPHKVIIELKNITMVRLQIEEE